MLFPMAAAIPIIVAIRVVFPGMRKVTPARAPAAAAVSPAARWTRAMLGLAAAMGETIDGTISDATSTVRPAHNPTPRCGQLVCTGGSFTRRCL